MPLTSGTRLGPYEIVAPLGAGGMGEVFRARDTSLGRDVAVKVLPQHLSANPEMRVRFEREAKTVSSLNHPNICTLFDVGREGDTDFLVMELIEGETLAPVPPIMPPQDGFLFLDKAKFRESFAADVESDAAAFMADAQVPWGLEALNGAVTEPAWKSKPSWYLAATNDKMIPPDAQRAMSKRTGATVVEVKGSHPVYVSQPREVAHLIEQASKSLSLAAK